MSSPLLRQLHRDFTSLLPQPGESGTGLTAHSQDAHTETGEETVAEPTTLDPQAALQLVRADAPRTLTNGLFAAPPATESSEPHSHDLEENQNSLRISFDRNLQAFLARRVSDPEAAARLLPALSEAAATIRDHPSAENSAELLSDLIRLRRFYQGGIAYYEARRLSEGESFDGSALVEFRRNLRNLNAALNTLRGYFRSSLNDSEATGTNTRLLRAQWAAQISHELGHFAGLTLDLRNWETQITAARESGEISSSSLIENYTALMSAWSAVRSAHSREVGGREGQVPIPFSDAQLETRLRGLAESLVALVQVEFEYNERVAHFDTRLNHAIDQVDATFLGTLSGENLNAFMQMAEYADTLRADMGESPGAESFLRQLQAATLYGALGLNEEVRSVLNSTEAYVASLPLLSERMAALMNLAKIYQSSGQLTESNRLLASIATMGEDSSQAALQDTGTLARAMVQLNHGELRAAAETLAGIAHDPRAQALMTPLAQGQRSERQAQVYALWQGALQDYVSGLRETEAPEVDQIEGQLSSALATAHAQVQTGQAENLFQALQQMRSGEVQHYLLSDHTHAHYLESLSNLELSEEDFAREVLAAAQDYLRSERYPTAATLAQFVRDDPQVGVQARELLSDLPDQVMMDATWTALGNMSILFAESEAEAVRSGILTIATFGLASWLGVEAEVFYQGTRISTRLAAAGYTATDQMIGWGVSSATNAAVFTAGGFATDAAFGHTDHLTVSHFFREFGAMLVTFGMFRSVTSSMRRFSQPVQQQLAQAERLMAQAQRTGIGVEAATQRLQGAQWSARRMALISWGTRVSALTGSGYINEGIGLHEANGASLGPRLFSSAVMDAQMMLAHRAVNGLSGGRLERLQQQTHTRYAERAVRASGPRIQEIIENLEHNSIVDSADPMAHYVRAALEQSAALTGSSRVGEVLATRQGRRALFAAIDALGIEPGSRAYEMVATAVILNTLPASPTRAQFLQALGRTCRHLAQHAELINRLSGQMTESIRQSAITEGVELTPEQIDRYQDTFTGQLAERVLRNQMGEAELTEIHRGLNDGTVELMVHLDFHSGEFNWEFQRTPLRVVIPDSSVQRNLTAGIPQPSAASPEVVAPQIQRNSDSIIIRPETTQVEAPLTPVIELAPHIPRNIPRPIHGIARSAAAMLGLSTGLNLLDVNLAHAATDVMSTAESSGLTAGLITGALSLGALAMVHRNGSNGNRHRISTEQNSDETVEAFASISSRLNEISAQIPRTEGLQNLRPEVVRDTMMIFRSGTSATTSGPSSLPEALQALHREIRNFQGSIEQVVALSETFRAIVFPSLQIPTTAMTDFIQSATSDPQRAFLEILPRAFSQLADAFDEIPEHREPLRPEEIQEIIRVLEIYSSLKGIGQEEQVHEALQSLSHLRELLPPDHVERHRVEKLRRTLQNIAEELPLFDPRPLALSIVAAPWITTSLLLTLGSEISTTGHIALAGALPLINYAAFNSALLMRNIQRYGAVVALNHFYDNLTYFRNLIENPRLLLRVLHRPPNHEGHFADVEFVTRQRINAILSNLEESSGPGSSTALLLALGTGATTLLAANDAYASVGTVADSGMNSGTLGLISGLGLVTIGGVFSWANQRLRRLFGATAPTPETPTHQDTLTTDLASSPNTIRFTNTEMDRFVRDLANPDGFAVLEALIRVGDVFPHIPEEDRLRVMIATVRVLRRPELQLRLRAEQTLRSNLHFVSEYQASYYALSFLSEIDFEQDLERSLAATRLLQHALMAMGRARLPQLNQACEERWDISILGLVQQVDILEQARTRFAAYEGVAESEQANILREVKKFLRTLRIPALRQALLNQLPPNFADSYEELQSFAQHQGREDETVPVASGRPQPIADTGATIPEARGLETTGVDVDLEVNGAYSFGTQIHRGTLVPGHLESPGGLAIRHFLVGRVFRSGYRELVDLIPMENGIAVEGARPLCLMVMPHSAGQLAVGQEVSFIPAVEGGSGSGEGPYREPQAPSESFEILSQRLRQVSAQLDSTHTENLPATVQALYQALRHFQGSPEEIVQLSRSFRAIAFRLLTVAVPMLPEISDNNAGSSAEPVESRAELTTVDPGNRFENQRPLPRLAEGRIPLAIDPSQSIRQPATDLTINTTHLFGSHPHIETEQFNEILHTLSQLREALPKNHPEHGAVRDLIEELQGMSEESGLLDPRSTPAILTATAVELLPFADVLLEWGAGPTAGIAAGLLLLNSTASQLLPLARLLRRFGPAVTRQQLAARFHQLGQLATQPELHRMFPRFLDLAEQLRQRFPRAIQLPDESPSTEIPAEHYEEPETIPEGPRVRVAEREDLEREVEIVEAEFEEVEAEESIPQKTQSQRGPNGSGTLLTTLVAMGTSLATLFGSEVAYAATNMVHTASSQAWIPSLISAALGFGALAMVSGGGGGGGGDSASRQLPCPYEEYFKNLVAQYESRPSLQQAIQELWELSRQYSRETPETDHDRLEDQIFSLMVGITGSDPDDAYRILTQEYLPEAGILTLYATGAVTDAEANTLAGALDEEHQVRLEAISDPGLRRRFPELMNQYRWEIFRQQGLAVIITHLLDSKTETQVEYYGIYWDGLHIDSNRPERIGMTTLENVEPSFSLDPEPGRYIAVPVDAGSTGMKGVLAIKLRLYTEMSHLLASQEPHRELEVFVTVEQAEALNLLNNIFEPDYRNTGPVLIVTDLQVHEPAQPSISRLLVNLYSDLENPYSPIYGERQALDRLANLAHSFRTPHSRLVVEDQLAVLLPVLRTEIEERLRPFFFSRLARELIRMGELNLAEDIILREDLVLSEIALTDSSSFYTEGDQTRHIFVATLAAEGIFSGPFDLVTHLLNMRDPAWREEAWDTFLNQLKAEGAIGPAREILRRLLITPISESFPESLRATVLRRLRRLVPDRNDPSAH